MTTRWPDRLPAHDRFDYRPITRRPDYLWPNGARLAVYLGFNIEHFAFGVPGVGGYAEKNFRLIRLVRIEKIGREFGGFAKT